MKEEIKFKKFDNNDTSSLVTLVDLHCSVHQNTFFKNRLIYFDDNFYDFLNKLIKDENHFFYVVEANSSLIGFTHLRLIDDFLFLNTISVSNEYSGHGLGKKLLSYSIQEVSKSIKNVSVLKLDVFRSNHRAFSWYKKLGFIEEKITTWYQFNEVFSKEELNFSIKSCKNGFLSLFFNTTKIATIINNNLILHDSNYIFYIDLTQFQSAITNDDSFKTNILFEDSLLKFEIIDDSIKMSVELKKIIKNLRNV